MQMEEKPTTRRALLCKLFFTMLKIGLFTFGGGYAMLALFESEFVDRKKWIDKDEFIDMVAISESTPGPLAINGATYVGYKIAGFFGALCSTVAVCIPSFAIIYIISLFFDRFLSLTVVAYAFAGIRVSVVWLILSAGVRVFRGLEKSAFNYILAGVVFVLMVGASLFAADFSSILAILLCGALGVAVSFAARLAKKGRDK